MDVDAAERGLTPLAERLHTAHMTFSTFPRSGASLFGEAGEAIDRLYAVMKGALDRLMTAALEDDWSAIHDLADEIERTLNAEHTRGDGPL